MNLTMIIEALAVALLCGAVWLVYRKLEEEAEQTEAIIGNISMETLTLKKDVEALQTKLDEYEKAFGKADEFQATISAELEKQARLEKEWTEGLGNILSYSLKDMIRGGISDE